MGDQKLSRRVHRPLASLHAVVRCRNQAGGGIRTLDLILTKDSLCQAELLRHALYCTAISQIRVAKRAAQYDSDHSSTTTTSPSTMSTVISVWTS